MAKKGEMGVGTLIVFIAMLLVAAVAAGVLIQTVSSLQEKSLSTGQQARSQISTNAEVIEVSATDGRTGNLTDFQQLVKLSPGSDPMKLSQVIFAFNTKDDTSTLKYRGTGSVCEKNNVDGYNTWNIEELGEVGNGTAVKLAEDLDDDGQFDTVIVGDSTTLTFNLSSAGFLNVSMTDISGAANNAVDPSVSGKEISDENETYGYVTIEGKTSTNNTIDENVTFKVEPYRLGEGYFSAVYEQVGSNHVDGNLQRGDVIKLCYEAPGTGVSEDQLVRLNFIPKIGTPTLTQFVSPDVISTQRVYLYP
ncbi:MAG: archaellin/type IV pilin N-terminal domain-containing protein [Nanobdellota archaeon]